MSKFFVVFIGFCVTTSQFAGNNVLDSFVSIVEGKLVGNNIVEYFYKLLVMLNNGGVNVTVILND